MVLRVSRLDQHHFSHFLCNDNQSGSVNEGEGEHSMKLTFMMVVGTVSDLYCFRCGDTVGVTGMGSMSGDYSGDIG